tara:strand:- start:145 stop:1140 length:996 start_codon:yes stop_codon:yes gene_type:complete
MKTKNILYLLTILCLAFVSYKLINKETSITRTDRRDFAIADTSNVVKVILSSKMPETAIIERISTNNWTVNGDYKARKSAVFYLLKTLQRMEIAHPVALTMRDNVLGNLAVRGIKVQVFLKDGTEKTFYVGGENQELSATFMMLQGATDPYAIHIPGFKGYLSTRFFTAEYIWRDKTVLNYDNLAINTVSMRYYGPKMVNESFVLSRGNENTFSLSNYKGTTKLELNPTKLQTYLGSFRKLNSEGFISGSLNVDSILNVKPVFDLVVSNNKGEETQVTAYYKKAKDGTHVEGDVTMRDPERMYALINKEDWVIIQLNSFGRVMKSLSDLKK